MSKNKQRKTFKNVNIIIGISSFVLSALSIFNILFASFSLALNIFIALNKFPKPKPIKIITSISITIAITVVGINLTKLIIGLSKIMPYIL